MNYSFNLNTGSKILRQLFNVKSHKETATVFGANRTTHGRSLSLRQASTIENWYTVLQYYKERDF